MMQLCYVLAVLKYNANVKYNASGNTTLVSSVEMFNLLVTTVWFACWQKLTRRLVTKTALQQLEY